MAERAPGANSSREGRYFYRANECLVLQVQAFMARGIARGHSSLTDQRLDLFHLRYRRHFFRVFSHLNLV